MSTTTTTLVDSLQAQAAAVAPQVMPVMEDWAREMLTWLRATKDFAVEQAPDLALQICRWGLAQAVVETLVGLLVLGLIVRYVKKWGPPFWEWAKDESAEPAVVAAVLGLGVFSVTIAGATYDSLLTAVKVFVAPKVYLIEYLSKLVH